MTPGRQLTVSGASIAPLVPQRSRTLQLTPCNHDKEDCNHHHQPPPVAPTLIIAMVVVVAIMAMVSMILEGVDNDALV